MRRGTHPAGVDRIDGMDRGALVYRPRFGAAVVVFRLFQSLPASDRGILPACPAASPRSGIDARAAAS
jgi:hypothetical protein